MTEQTYHVPVLLNESVNGLNIHNGGTYVDVTFGGGGHSKEILRRLNGTGRLFSFDQDEDAEKNIGDTYPNNFTFVRSNFRYLKNWMRYYGIERIDGLLADLGVSSHHFDDETRGFSFRFDAPLDMRMNKRAGITAADILNEYEEERLAEIFFLYGEYKNSRRLASAISKARQAKRINSTQDFLQITEPFLGKEREKKELAKLFQALRIEVNHEMDALKDMLIAATELLGEDGRLSVITYHSLEDRIVKNIIKSGNVTGVKTTDFYGVTKTPFRTVNNKVIVPSLQEQQENPRSRSAKLRIASKNSTNNG
jgi:16S rRNA (cytosine1402-N4)-methyltransferase